MPKDWKGNNISTYAMLSASSHSSRDRQQHDYYATDPEAAEMLIEIESLTTDKPVWECACGEKHLSNVFERRGFKVRSSDIIQRIENIEQLDFLSPNNTEPWHGHIITNPPFAYAEEFIQKALSLLADGCKVIMFLKLQFLEGKSRRELFSKYPPKTVWVSSSRIRCAPNGDFNAIKSSAVAYAWYVWEKGYDGKTTLKWFN